MKDHSQSTAKFIFSAFEKKALRMDVECTLDKLLSSVEKVMEDSYGIFNAVGLKLKLKRHEKYSSSLHQTCPTKVVLKRI